MALLAWTREDAAAAFQWGAHFEAVAAAGALDAAMLADAGCAFTVDDVAAGACVVCGAL